jgi:hypothetical protein
VKRIEGPNRFDRKRPAHAGENRLGHPDQVAATLKAMKRADRNPSVVGRQPPSRASAKNCPCGLGDRQR